MTRESTMGVVIFGAIGMVGSGVLRECLLDPRVEGVVTVGRKPSGTTDPKLTEILLSDLFAPGDALDALTGLDACFYCLGVSAAGMDEPAYSRITHDLTIAIARPLADRNPGIVFIYVSGLGTAADSRMMWARFKARTETALAALPFGAVYAFRPGFIQPLHGAVSSTGWYRALYAVLAPLARAFPGAVTTTERVGRAMIATARGRGPSRALGNRAINEAAAAADGA